MCCCITGKVLGYIHGRRSEPLVPCMRAMGNTTAAWIHLAKASGVGLAVFWPSELNPPISWDQWPNSTLLAFAVMLTSACRVVQLAGASPLKPIAYLCCPRPEYLAIVSGRRACISRRHESCRYTFQNRFQGPASPVFRHFDSVPSTHQRSFPTGSRQLGNMACWKVRLVRLMGMSGGVPLDLPAEPELWRFSASPDATETA